MVRVPIPLVVNDTFFVSGNTEEGNAIQVNSAAWYNWLSNTEHHSFSMHCPAGAFTARHEQQRHGWYWYAYRKLAGKAYKLYLGKAQDVTQQRLYDVATRLANKGVPLKGLPSGIDPQLLASDALSSMHIRASKFSMPAIEILRIPRPHLLSKLEAGRKKKLILLSAQAGWGKTLLLSSWCTLLSRQKSPFAWISLDTSDNNLSTFWSTFINALQLLQPGLGQRASQLLQDISNSSIERVLQTLLDECVALKKEGIIFLDDVHVLTSPTLQQSISFFLEYLPYQLHLVMASRVDPPLPLARLRVQGKLLEIRATDLALNLAEINSLIEDTVHLSLSQQELRLLEQRTEGWPAGIYLAAQLLKEAPDAAQALAHLSGSTHIIRDYFIEEVVLQQPISIQDFLLQTSMLTRLSSQLCDAVCANTSSQARLEYLRQNNLFVTLLDGQGLYYRYHPLFQEALQAWLRQEYPLLERDLQERTAFWYEQQSTHRQVQTKAEMARPSTQPLSSTLPVYLLTEREREVLTLLLHGASNREIAQDLTISEGTTKKHIANICSKFHVQRRTQVITKMLEQVAM